MYRHFSKLNHLLITIVILTLLYTSLYLGFSGPVVYAATTTYTADNSVFPNPERGFYNRKDVVVDRSFASLSNTIVHSYVRIDAYKGGGDIGFNDSVMSGLRAGLNAIRADGKKVILRFAYNFGDYVPSPPYCTNADATQATIVKHIGQVVSSLEPYKDVIMAFEAGFIGCWGEWHSSWYQGDAEMPPKIAITQSMADTFNWSNTGDASLPFTPPLAIRYPNLLRNLVNSSLSASAKNRLGSHQDCFLASDPDDWGTWSRDPAYTPDQDKQFVGSIGVDHLVGGETCNVSSPRVNCPTARTEMQLMHFTYLNEDYEANVIQVFKNQGCFTEFQQKLGYRLRLSDATYPTSPGAGSSFNLQVNLANDGYASLVSGRPVFAVLDGSGGTFTFRLSADPRTWESGQPAAINESFTLPANMPSGAYRLSLWLPDKATNLRTDSRYSIRFANQNTWDASKGYNVLATNIQVGGGGGATSTPTRTPTATATQTNTPTGPTSTPGSVSAYEAESSSNTLAGGAAVSACGPCSGGNKVGYVGNNSGTLQFNGVNASTAGSYTLTIYYTNGDSVSRSATVSVNGGAGTNVNFPVTGGWTTVGSVQTTINLNAGSNTIKFSNATGWAPDFDRITVNTGPSPTATATPTRTNTPTGPTNTPTNTVPPTNTPTRTNTPIGPTNTPTNTPVAPTATPTSNGTSLLLDNFDGNPAWPSTNDLGKWTGANSFVNGGGAGALSSGALALQYNNAGWFGSDVLQDISSKTYLVFVIKGAAGGEQNAFHVILGGVEKTLGAFSGDTLTTSYKTIRINMAAQGINRASPGQLQLTFWWGSSGTVTIDEIRFEN